MHGIEIFESPNLNITPTLKLYPIKIHMPKLGPQAVPSKLMGTKLMNSCMKKVYITLFYDPSHIPALNINRMGAKQPLLY